jgi:predicted ATPase
MLTELRLRDFKSMEDQTVPFHPLTLLVGANGAGKSNVLDALCLLQGLAIDLPLRGVLCGESEGGREVWPGVRGGVGEVVRKGAGQFTLHSRWRRGGQTFAHEITCAVNTSPRVVGEGLFAGAADAPRVAARGEVDDRGGATLRATVPRRGKAGPLDLPLDARRSLLGQLRAGQGVGRATLEARDWIVGRMRATHVLALQPAQMRGYAPKGARFVGLAGEMLSSVAWEVCQDAGAKADLVDWLSALGGPDWVDIDTAQSDLGDVMLVLVEAGGARIPARSLSDGTLRLMALLLALRTAPSGSMLLIDGMEWGLHPARAHLLVEAMAAATETRDIQVIATTHSSQVLQALPPEALRQAILVARAPDGRGSHLCPLGALPGFDAVVERRGVAALHASGWLERAL